MFTVKNQMSRAAAFENFNKTLIKFFNGIENIFRLQTIEVTTWIELYTIVFDCCASCSLIEWTLYATATGRQKYLLAAGINSDNNRFCGGELYHNMENYLINYVKNLYQMSDNMSNENLLQFYIDQWKKYQHSSKILNYIFRYLHQHWVPKSRRHGFTSIYDISTLLMLIWQEILLKPIGNRLTNACLNMIEIERKNHVMINNIQLIKDVIDNYMAFNFDHDMPIWFHEESTIISPINVYKEWFGIPFIENTKQFYQAEASKHFADESLILYLTKVSKYLNEEEHRVHSYVRLSLPQSFLETVEEILIHNYVDDICYAVRNMLLKENYEDLKCLLEPIKRMTVTKTKIKTLVKDYIYQIGYQSIEHISEIAVNDPKIFVKTIVETYEKLSEFLRDTLLNHLVFVDAFNQAFDQFINSNALTNAGKKSSELLAQYCDKLLRNTNKTLQESEFEKNLNDMMIVFDYIEDKDSFELFYRKFLSKRLINQQSISHDYEAMIISKLKQTCGLTYTSKLENMLKDIYLNQDLMNNYQTYCSEKQIMHTFDFSGIVLSSSSWTLSISNDFNLPDKLKSVLNDFTTFYTSRHTGRKLKLHCQHSTGELEMFCSKKKYILQVTTYQMIILLLFNESIEWTIEEIQNKTELNLNLLRTSVHNLLKYKILISNDNSIFRLSEDFRYNKIRINLNIPLKSIEQKEIEILDQKLDEDRKIVIQTIIVRIMKARQILKYTSLIQEVIQQLKLRFKPQIFHIKKCIDILIEKEYLERDSKEIDLLRYRA